MEILFTPAARSQLLELVATMRDRDRLRAIRLVSDLEERLRGIVDGTSEECDLPPLELGAGDRHSLRVFTWRRDGTLWVLAMWLDETHRG